MLFKTIEGSELSRHDLKCVKKHEEQRQLSLSLYFLQAILIAYVFGCISPAWVWWTW